MACLAPYQAVQYAPGAKLKILPPEHSWLESSNHYPKVYTIPCGKCILCKQTRAFEIAVRARCEHAMQQESAFITLTVSDENMQQVFPGMKLRHDPFQKFMKRLRKRGIKCRYLMCGEYGDKFGRPHYHVILFGWMPKDFYFDQDGHRHGSKLLEECWPFGHVTVSPVNDNRIFYVSGYTMKARPDSYARWSRRPGLGAAFFDKFYQSIYHRECSWLRLDDGELKAINRYVSDYFTGKGFQRLKIKYFNDRLALTSPERFGILQSSSEEYGLLLNKKSREQRLLDARNLKNRAVHIEYQLARKAREVQVTENV